MAGFITIQFPQYPAVFLMENYHSLLEGRHNSMRSHILLQLNAPQYSNRGRTGNNPSFALVSLFLRAGILSLANP
jgi:hypothetical protein